MSRKFLVINYEGLIDKRYLNYEDLSFLSKEYDLVLLYNIKKEAVIEDLKKDKLEDFFKRIYPLRKFIFEERFKVFEKIKEHFSIKGGDFFYLVGESPLDFPYEEIRSFTKKIIPFEKESLFHQSLPFKKCLISLDLDGVFNDISSYKINHYNLCKQNLEEKFNKKLNSLEFLKIWSTLDKETKNKIKISSSNELELNIKIRPWIKGYIKKISKDNVLVLFSVTSKRRIESFLKRNNLENYFSKIYSGVDFFGLKSKKGFMFKKIKEDFFGFKRYIHLGDFYGLDYIEPKKAGFEAYLVNNSPLKVLFLEDLIQKKKNKKV